MKVTHSCPTLCNSPGQNAAVGSHPLLQGIFPTQGLNPGLPHYRQILFQLSHRGSHSAIRVVSSAYLRLLILLPAILIPAYTSSSPAFLMMYSAYKLSKQDDNIQSWCTPFPIWNHSVVPCSNCSNNSSGSNCWLFDHITVIQVYASTTNAEESEVEPFYEDLQDLLELTPKKDILFTIGDWNAKVESQETPGVTGKFGLAVQNEAGQRLKESCQENALVIANTFFQQHKKQLFTWTSPDSQYWIRLIVFL